jgi:transcriptional regulator with GAF, ATPase, and Fis domain
MTNKELFLQDAILNIFKSKDTELLLSESFQCIKKYIPIVAAVNMTFYMKDTHSLYNLCIVGKNILPKGASVMLPKCWKDKYPHDDVFFYNEAVNLFGEEIPAFIGKKYNYIVLQCRTSQETLGCFTLSIGEENTLSYKYKELMRDLIVPYTRVLCNELINKRIFRYQGIQDQKKVELPKIDSDFGDEIIGADNCLKETFELAANVAKFNSAVLLTGETGVGKDVFANYIHKKSSRQDEAFVKVNCGTIPETLIDNELFGHEKGAFTGADSVSKGRFELADNGTLFLDEIAELPLNSQAKLLRIIQFGELERLGGGKPIKVNVRIIAATNKNLLHMIEEGKFRDDLYWRLNVYPIEIPPVRERKGDIPLLIKHIMKKVCCRLGISDIPEISDIMMKKLLDYNWPGNVREMENVIEREVINNHRIGMKFECISNNDMQEQTEQKLTVDGFKNQCVITKDRILKTLEQTKWRVSGKNGAAYILGLHPNTLRYKMKKLGIN